MGCGRQVGISNACIPGSVHRWVARAPPTNIKEESMCFVAYPSARLGKTIGIVSQRTLRAARYSCALLSCGLVGRVGRKTFVVLQGALVLFLLGGCASSPPRL